MAARFHELAITTTAHDFGVVMQSIDNDAGQFVV
jgi:hypothetical protein